MFRENDASCGDEATTPFVSPLASDPARRLLVSAALRRSNPSTRRRRPYDPHEWGKCIERAAQGSIETRHKDLARVVGGGRERVAALRVKRKSARRCAPSSHNGMPQVSTEAPVREWGYARPVPSGAVSDES